MSYIYGAPSKARNANVVYIWTYVWQRRNSRLKCAISLYHSSNCVDFKEEYSRVKRDMKKHRCPVCDERTADFVEPTFILHYS